MSLLSMPTLKSPKTKKFSYLDEYKTQPLYRISKWLIITFLYGGCRNNIANIYFSGGLSLHKNLRLITAPVNKSFDGISGLTYNIVPSPSQLLYPLLHPYYIL